MESPVTGLVAACARLRTAVETAPTCIADVSLNELRQMNDSILWVLAQGFGTIPREGVEAAVVAEPIAAQSKRAELRADRRYCSPADVNILVCDDDVVFSTVLVMRMRALGFNMTAVSSGGDAIRALLCVFRLTLARIPPSLDRWSRRRAPAARPKAQDPSPRSRPPISIRAARTRTAGTSSSAT